MFRQGSNECDSSSSTARSSSVIPRSSPVILSAAKDLAAHRDRPFAEFTLSEANGLRVTLCDCSNGQGLFFTIEPCLSLNTLLMNIRFLIGISYETIPRAMREGAPPRMKDGVFQYCSAGRPVALMGSIQVQFVTNGLAASVNLCFLCFVGKFRNTFSRDAMQNTAGLQNHRGRSGEGSGALEQMYAPQNSGVCAEVLAQGDHVALGISNHHFSVEPWHCLDRGGFKPSFPKLSNMVLQVVHEEREQGLAAPVGVTDHVDPSGICYLPHAFLFRHAAI